MPLRAIPVIPFVTGHLGQGRIVPVRNGREVVRQAEDGAGGGGGHGERCADRAVRWHPVQPQAPGRREHPFLLSLVPRAGTDAVDIRQASSV